MIVLKGNPKSTQSIYRVNCSRGFPTMYMTAEGKAIKEAYTWEMRATKPKIELGPIKLILRLYFNTKAKHDIDNFNKLILDAGTGILWTDDSQIQELNISKFYDKETPRVELELSTL